MPSSSASLLQAMHDRQVDGIILASMYTSDHHAAQGHQPPRPPCCSTRSRSSRPRCPSVLPDEVEAGRAAARVLLDAGHRDGIHLIGAGPGLRDVPAGGASRRWSGSPASVRRSREAGVKVASGRAVARLAAARRPGCDRATSSQRTRPRALICLNDRLAMGAYQALDDAGLRGAGGRLRRLLRRPPHRVVDPPELTTVALPHYELGRKAVDVLFDEIGRDRDAGDREARVHRVAMPIRVRGSVGPPSS